MGHPSSLIESHKKEKLQLLEGRDSVSRKERSGKDSLPLCLKLKIDCSSLKIENEKCWTLFIV
jgi:hypothetical protein